MNLKSDLRSMIYQVGSKVDNDPSKLDRQRGKTFIETPDVATIAKELQHLISFSVQSGWSGVNTHLQQIAVVFNSIQESSDASEDKRELLAAELTLDTSLLSGLLS